MSPILLQALIRQAKKVLGPAQMPPEDLAYRQLRQKDFVPASIVDVGAYQGDWISLARRFLPEVARQGSKRPHLERVGSELPSTTYVEALLERPSAGTAEFFEMATRN